MLRGIREDDGKDQISGLFFRVHKSEQIGPLLLLVHGRAGNDTLMWIFSKCFEQFKPFTVAVLAPYEDVRGGRSWWRVSDEDYAFKADPLTAEAERNSSAEQLVKFVTELKSRYHLPADTPVVGVGFSQGAAILLKCAREHNNFFAGLALLAGPLGVILREPASAPALNRPDIFLYYGEKDEVVSPTKVDSWARQLSTEGFSVELVAEDVAHKVGVQGMRRLATWLKRFFPTL